MSTTESLEEFMKALEMVKALLSLERNVCRNPPRKEERPEANGLRGGAAVLMVAIFERFLSDAFEEHLDPLRTASLGVDLSQLPEELQVCNVFENLDLAIRGRPHRRVPKKVDSISEINRVCRLLGADVVIPDAFSETGYSPNPKTVRSMFKNVGIKTVFQNIRLNFNRQWGMPIAHEFIPDKLTEIVQRRHRVAHSGIALDITRTQLRESVKFLMILARLLDAELSNHIRGLLPA